MRSVKIALGVALGLMAFAIGVVLSHAPLTVAGSNDFQAPHYRDGAVEAAATRCQLAGTVPEGTTAIRISLGANIDPRIAVKVFEGSRLVTQGSRGAGGGLNASATVPVSRVASTAPDARLCVTLGPDPETIGVRGESTELASGSVFELRSVELRTEYLRPGPASWWSRISSIAHRFGLGRGDGGTWVGFLVLALMLAVVVLISRLTLSELR
jgi:hypothetical protein